MSGRGYPHLLDMGLNPPPLPQVAIFANMDVQSSTGAIDFVYFVPRHPKNA